MVPKLIWLLERVVATYFVICVHVLVWVTEPSLSGLIHGSDNTTQESKVTSENNL